MNLSQFTKNIGLILLLNILVKPVSFILEMMVQDEVGHEAWGVYAALFSMTFMLAFVSDLGTNQYYIKTVAENPEKNKPLFRTIFGFKLISLITLPVLSLFVGFMIGYKGNTLIYLSIISFTAALIRILSFYRSVLQGAQRFRADAFASVGEKFFLTGIIFILLSTAITVPSFIIGRLSSVLLICVILFIVLRKLRLSHPPILVKSSLQQVLTQSFPFALVAVLYSFHERIDQLMVERMIDEHESGLYAGAYRWLDLTMMYLWILFPMFFARLAYHKTTEAQKSEIVTTGISISAIPTIIIGGVGIFYGEVLLLPFTNSSGAELQTMTTCLQYLFTCLIVHGFFSLLGVYMNAMGFVNLSNKIAVIIIILNIGLNAIFIPKYGAIAAAMTTLVSTSVGYISYIYVISRYTAIRPPYHIWLKLLVTCGIYLGGLYAMKINSFEWYISVPAVSVVIILLSIQFNILNIQKLRNL